MNMNDYNKIMYWDKSDFDEGILTIPKEAKALNSTSLTYRGWSYQTENWIEESQRRIDNNTEYHEFDDYIPVKTVEFEKNSNLTRIGNGIFANYRDLEDLELPESVTEIWGYFCANCTSLKKVMLSKNLKEIGGNAFQNCPNLKFLIAPANVKGLKDISEKVEFFIEYSSKKEKNGLTSQNVKSLKHNKKIIISGVKEVCANTFVGFEDVENIIIEEGVKIIGDYAFTGCKNLKRVTLPKSLEYIGDGVFWGCKSLESIIITPSELNRHEDAFGASNSIVNLPSKIKFIGKKAFEGCEKITEVILPEKLNALSDFMFKDCQSLKTVEKKYGNGLKQIGANVFQNCTNLENFGEYGKHVQGVEIPISVKEIGAAAFKGCERIIKVILPNKISKLGESAFANCFSLVNVNLPENLTDIGNECFKNCRKISTIVLSKNIENVGKNAFEGCSELHTVVSGHNDEWFLEKGIRENAFKGCPMVEFTLGVEDNSATQYRNIGGDMYGCAYVPKKEFPITFANIWNAITNNKGLGR